MAEQPVIIETGSNPVGSVIWLHGLGADGHDFEPIVPELRLPAELPLRFVFPHAPVRSVTLNNGLPMRAWFDILSLDRGGNVDAAGIDASCDAIDALVEAEIAAGYSASRIVLAGFSQGGVIATHAALRSDRRFAGLLLLSTYLPLASRLESYDIDAALPVMFAHGQFDPVLELALGRESFAALSAAGLEPTWRDYPMPHSVCPEEIRDIAEWLQARFSA